MSEYNDSDRILNSENKEITNVTGELAFLFRKLLIQRKVSLMNWDKFMDVYLNDPTNQIPPNGKDRSSTRGNMNKALLSNNMTWKVFKKALKFIGVMKVRVEIHTTWRDGSTTIEKINTVLHRQYIEDDEVKET